MTGQQISAIALSPNMRKSLSFVSRAQEKFAIHSTHHASHCYLSFCIYYINNQIIDSAELLNLESALQEYTNRSFVRG